MQWLQDQTQSIVDNVKNLRCEASRHFRNKNKEYLKAKIDELETNSKIRRPSGSLAKEHGSPKLVILWDTKGLFFIWVNKLKIRWAGQVACMGERRGVYRILLGKPEGKRPPRRPRHKWEDNIKMDLREVGCGGMDWIELAEDWNRWVLVNEVMNLRVP